MSETDRSLGASSNAGPGRVRPRGPAAPKIGHLLRSPNSRPNEQHISQAAEAIGMSPPEAILDRNESNTRAVSGGSEHAKFRGATKKHASVLAATSLPTVRTQSQHTSDSPSQEQSASMVANDPESLYEQHHQLHDRRGKTIETRFGMIGQRTALQKHMIEYQEALGSLSTLLEEFKLDNARSEEIYHIRSSIAGVQRSQISLSQQLQQTKDFEAHLNLLEYELGKEENQFFSSLRTTIPSLIRTAQSPDKILAPASESTLSHAARKEDEDLLHTFYDRSSDIPILQERLAELEDTFAYERAQRETRADLGQPISPPDLEFYTQYYQDKETLQLELSHKRSEVAQLRTECIRLGLLPENPSGPNRSMEIGSKSEENAHRARSWAHFPESTGALEQSFLSDPQKITPTFVNPRERIDTWLAEAQITEAPEAPTTEYDESRRAVEAMCEPRPESATPTQPGSELPESSLKSWVEVDDGQLGHKRNISDSSTISRLSRTDQEPPQKSPKPS